MTTTDSAVVLDGTSSTGSLAPGARDIVGSGITGVGSFQGSLADGFAAPGDLFRGPGIISGALIPIFSSYSDYQAGNYYAAGSDASGGIGGLVGGSLLEFAGESFGGLFSAGAEAGAEIGSFGGPIGAAVGAFLGGVGGALFGYYEWSQLTASATNPASPPGDSPANFGSSTFGASTFGFSNFGTTGFGGNTGLDLPSGATYSGLTNSSIRGQFSYRNINATDAAGELAME